MTRAAAEYLRHTRREAAEQARPREPIEERKALARLRQEARAAGAQLKKAGKGGLPSSFALGAYRRGKYACAVHGDRGEGEYGGLELHHRRHPKPGQRDRVEDVYVVCSKAHDEIHNPQGEEN